MTDSIDPVPDFDLELWAEATYPGHGKFRVRAARLAHELLALRKVVRALLRIADDGSGVASCANAWDDARALLPEYKEPPA